MRGSVAGGAFRDREVRRAQAGTLDGLRPQDPGVARSPEEVAQGGEVLGDAMPSPTDGTELSRGPGAIRRGRLGGGDGVRPPRSGDRVGRREESLDTGRGVPAGRGGKGLGRGGTADGNGLRGRRARGEADGQGGRGKSERRGQARRGGSGQGGPERWSGRLEGARDQVERTIEGPPAGRVGGGRGADAGGPAQPHRHGTGQDLVDAEAGRERQQGRRQEGGDGLPQERRDAFHEDYHRTRAVTPLGTFGAQEREHWA